MHLSICLSIHIDGYIDKQIDGVIDGSVDVAWVVGPCGKRNHTPVWYWLPLRGLASSGFRALRMMIEFLHDFTTLIPSSVS